VNEHLPADIDMTPNRYVYKFKDETSMEQASDLLLLSALATESLHGRSALRINADFLLENTKKTCQISSETKVGQDLAKIYTGLLSYHLGEHSYEVKLNKHQNAER
jgi:hypothetical protein